MGYLVSARRWRPQSFSSLMGQEHVSRTLKNAIASDRVGHAYLFAGPRGVGKTTAARIFAKALNCERGPQPEPCNECSICKEITEGRAPDVVEIDGASTRKIEHIRELIEKVRYSPARARFSIYIIDEVHMLTQEAFNALLKTLEEPPPHVKFIFATTELQKVPSTIRSRCQEFEFRLLPLGVILEQLRRMTSSEGMDIAEEALTLLARLAEGSMRDAQSLLDQVVSHAEPGAGRIGLSLVEELLGLPGREGLARVVDFLVEKDVPALLREVKNLSFQGQDLKLFCSGLLEHLRNLLVAKSVKEPGDLVEFGGEDLSRLKGQAGRLSLEQLHQFFTILEGAEKEVRFTPYPKLILEVALMRMAHAESLVPLEELLARFERLEGMPRAAREKVLSEPRGEPLPGGGKGTRERLSKSPASEKKRIGPGEASSLPGTQEERGGPPSQEGAAALWQEALKLIHERKPLLWAMLQEASPSFLPEEIELGFSDDNSNSFNRRQVEASLHLIRQAVEEVWGRRLRLRVVTRPGKRDEEEAPEKEKTLQEERECRAQHNALIQQVVDIFDGYVLEERERKG